jgi:hypothetical protein
VPGVFDEVHESWPTAIDDKETVILETVAVIQDPGFLFFGLILGPVPAQSFVGRNDSYNVASEFQDDRWGGKKKTTRIS